MKIHSYQNKLEHHKLRDKRSPPLGISVYKHYFQEFVDSWWERNTHTKTGELGDSEFGIDGRIFGFHGLLFKTRAPFSKQQSSLGSRVVKDRGAYASAGLHRVLAEECIPFICYGCLFTSDSLNGSSSPFLYGPHTFTFQASELAQWAQQHLATPLTQRDQAWTQSGENLLVEDNEEKSIRPALSRITDALHVDEDWMVQNVAVAILALLAVDGHKESKVAPHSEQKKNNWHPYQFLVHLGTSCLKLSLHVWIGTGATTVTTIRWNSLQIVYTEIIVLWRSCWSWSITLQQR